MALGGAVDDMFGREIAERVPDGRRVADVDAREAVAGVRLDCQQIGEVAGVTERVEDEDRRVRRDEPPDEGRPDEARTPRDQDASHGRFQRADALLRGWNRNAMPVNRRRSLRPSGICELRSA